MGLAVIVGLLIDLGYLALPHAGAMSFLGLIVFMNVALALEAQDRNRALKASSIELQQKIAQIYGTKDRLRKMAYHDFVTGLPNRAKLQEMLSECAAHKSGKGALILLDLDDFRTINDVLGHDFGDRLLRAIAARLLELEQAGGRSHLLHVGGDEFVVLLPEADADVAAAELEAQRLTRHNLAALNAPFLINGHSLTISASAGIALFPDGDESQGELLQRASMALQRAKSLGRGSIQLYAAEMRREVRERLRGWSAANSSCISSRRWISPGKSWARKRCCAGAIRSMDGYRRRNSWTSRNKAA
jgi:diguanylate cyclase (GGDEF)-like protein